MVLPEVDLKGAQQAAEKLRAVVENTKIKEIDRSVTISLGISSASAGALKDLETLIHDADQQLYQSKQNGRNRVSP